GSSLGPSRTGVVFAARDDSTLASRFAESSRTRRSASLRFWRRHHALAAVAQIGVSAALAHAFTMAPAARTFGKRSFFDRGGRLGRIFNDEIAENKKFLELFFWNRPDQFSIAFQCDASFE